MKNPGLYVGLALILSQNNCFGQNYFDNLPTLGLSQEKHQEESKEIEYSNEDFEYRQVKPKEIGEALGAYMIKQALPGVEEFGRKLREKTTLNTQMGTYYLDTKGRVNYEQKLYRPNNSFSIDLEANSDVEGKLKFKLSF